MGGIVDGSLGVVRPTPTRAWNILLAFESILHGEVEWQVLRRLLGHAVTICVLNRAGMSVFRALYDFVESQAIRSLNAKERFEVEIFVGLVPLLVGELRREWSETVLCIDASPDGYGLCQRQVEQAEVRRIGRWQDSWRFRHLEPSEWRPRQRTAGVDVLCDWDSVLGMQEVGGIEELYKVNGEFPEVPDYFTEPERWTTQLMGKWKDTSSHITAKEGHALVLALRHLCRSSSSRGKRHLILVDSFSLSLAICKGKASSFELLRTTQKVAALCLAGGFSIRTRWVASERNVADGPSRGQIKPGAYVAGAPDEKRAVIGESGIEAASQPAHSHKKFGTEEGEQRECGKELPGSGSEEDPACSGSFPTSQEGAEDYHQEDGIECRGRPLGCQKQAHGVGEAVSFPSGGEPVRELLHEVREFLPGSRREAAPLREGRRDPSRLYGRALPGGQRGSRRGENVGQRRVPAYRAQGQVGALAKGPARGGAASAHQKAGSRCPSSWHTP